MEEVEVDTDLEQLVNNTLEENNADNTGSELNTNVSPDKNNETSNQKHKFLRLPLARIKTMMKKDPDCGLLSQDAVFLVTKATEMFIEYLTMESGKQLAVMGKRKTVMRRDVDSVIQHYPQLCFLDGALD